MEKTSKIIIITMVIIIIVIAAVASTILKPEKTQVTSIKNPEFLINSFDSINFEVQTNKDRYSIGEEIIINAILTNTETINKSIFCQGWKNNTADERYNPFNFYAYVDDVSYIWAAHSYPDNVTRPIFIGVTDYNITLKASQSMITTYRWNQTYKQGDEWKQVPTGTYFIVADLDMTWEQYYGEGQAIPMNKFGDSTKIIIE